jgi:hypothetical protein
MCALSNEMGHTQGCVDIIVGQQLVQHFMPMVNVWIFDHLFELI